MPYHRFVATICVVAFMAGNANAGGMADTVRTHVDADRMVHATTGINPQDYPCARAGLIGLYEKREAVTDLSRYNPKRIFAWVLDTSAYYMYRFVDWLEGLMSKDAVMRGVDRVKGLARGGNPLAGMDRKVEGWASNLGPKSQFVLKRKMDDLIQKTTNEDGSCKK